MNFKTSILIPAFESDHHLLELVQKIRHHNASIPIIVVNDGSSDASQSIFAALPAFSVQVLHHAKNKGKGGALKTGFKYWQEQGGGLGLVTADSDGQHAVQDILKLVTALEHEPTALHLGCRKLNKEKTPLRSYLGNRLTAKVLSLFTHEALHDTQTGLRAIPAAFIPTLLNIESDGYALETEMLLLAKKQGIPLRTHTIQTIYIDHNQASHFNPFIDSIKIYWVFIRYLIIAILSAIIDLCAFVIFHTFTKDIFSSLIMARGVSGIFNYFCNRNTVFKSQVSYTKSALLYLLLVAANVGSSYFLIQLLIWLGLSVYLAKILSESILFILNFGIQRILIFKKTASANAN